MEEIKKLRKQASTKESEEATQLYNEIYSQFERLQSSGADVKQETLLCDWGLTLGSHSTQIHEEKEAKRLVELANKKFEDALIASPDNKHHVLLIWGNLYYEKGLKEKRSGNKAAADESFTESRSRYDRALELNPDYEEALRNLSRVLTEQGELKDGNQKFWFLTQAAEKEKHLGNLKAGVATAPTGMLSPENKILRANEYKEQGNEHFKKGDLSQALKSWYNALNFINGAYGFSTKQEQQVKEMKLALHNNMANVHIKQGKFDRAIQGLNQVLAIDPDNTKGLFRRGRAYLANNDIENARTDLNRAKTLSPDDKEIKNELLLLEKKEKLQDTKQKSFYAKMF